MLQMYEDDQENIWMRFRRERRPAAGRRRVETGHSVAMPKLMITGKTLCHFETSPDSMQLIDIPESFQCSPLARRCLLVCLLVALVVCPLSVTVNPTRASQSSARIPKRCILCHRRSGLWPMFHDQTDI
jgi:hypothetical protein